MKKTIKRRAFAMAMVMLMLTTVALTSSTFAWFTMGNSADVEAMELRVQSIEGIEISANAETWTGYLEGEDFFGEAFVDDDSYVADRYAAYEGNTNIYPSALTPVSSAFQSADTSTGFANFYKSAIDGGATTADVSAVVQNAEAGFVAFDLFFKIANETGAEQVIYFDESTFTDGSEEQKAPSALRVAFTPLGTVETTAEPAAATALNSFTASKTVSYEVDSLTRSEDATNNGFSAGAQQTKYLSSTATGVAVSNGILDTGNTINGTAVTDQSAASDKCFTLPAGITKVRVYIWMEGQDVDCVNSVAGSSLIADLKFTIAEE